MLPNPIIKERGAPSLKLPREILLEMKYLCLQYDRLRSKELSLEGNKDEADKPHEQVTRMIQEAARAECGDALAPHMINHICRGVPYAHLCGAPCSRSSFFRIKVKFLARLARLTGKI